MAAALQRREGHMLHIVADRFLPSGADWFDLATGARVRLHIASAGSMAAQLLWSARCTAQANLRHPLLNALLDFGVVDQTRTFEAYELQPPVHAAGAAAQTLLTHAVRFLEAHGIDLTRPLADFALRPIVSRAALGLVSPQRLRGHASVSRTSTADGRTPIGIVLQRRAAFEAIADALHAVTPAGACAVTVAGTADSGLRTLRTLAARAARLSGYLPVAASVLKGPSVAAAAFSGRHMCVLSDADAPDETSAAAALLARAGLEGGRRHIVLAFARDARGPRPVVQLEPMGLTAMSAMVFAERDYGPSADQIFSAARRAAGLPGVMLAQLGGGATLPAGSMGSVVRETAPSYRVPATQQADRAEGGSARRTATVALRAAERSRDLASGGRHAAASRLLARALRLLVARGARSEAARCAVAAGALALDRGRTDAAVRSFEQARDLAPDTCLSVEATIGVGSAWIDDGRLIDAEGALRTALLAANGFGDQRVAAAAAAGLAECLRLQGRARDAAAMPAVRSEQPMAALLAAAVARIHIALANLPAAVRAGRQAVAVAERSADPRTLVNARRALAEALLAAGDSAAALAEIGTALALSRRAHLPLESLRLHVVALAALSDQPSHRRRRAMRLAAAARRGVPRLLQLEIGAACAQAAGEPIAASMRLALHSCGASGVEQQYSESRGPVAELESLIELSHKATDDGAAVQQVCAALCERLRALSVVVLSSGHDGRTLALAGRPWPGDAPVVRRVLAAGLGAAPDLGSEPACAGEPVRYGGEVIAALAARWTAGTEIDSERASSLLRMGALAVAASVRALLDRSDPRGPQPRPDDMLGMSAAVRSLRDAIARAARAPFPVLIEGESGSGKELVARAIHKLGPRRERRFCPVNCAALSDELLEAELFGHARGAFTGAVGERAGLFEDADGGTLFLDEIGELSARAQAKLLRVLQDGEVRRVGENVSRRVDVRVVAATNRCLSKEADAGRFRPDLRFRLDVVRLEVPPLRERPGDVALLAAHFWTDAAARVGSNATLSPDTLAALSRYDWPGNVRELQNVMAWMAVHSPRRGRVGPAALPAHVAHSASPCSGSFEAAREEFERRFVRAALAAANGQRASAAAAIGVSRQGLAKMLRRLGIEGL